MSGAFRRRILALEAKTKPQTIWIAGGCGCAECLAKGKAQLARCEPLPVGTTVLQLITGIHRRAAPEAAPYPTNSPRR
jgi:hypothetical protein